VKPMLLPREVPDLETLPYPLLISPKLDGFRCMITENGPMTRSLKPIPNVNIRAMLEKLPVGLDGELVAGWHPHAKDIFNKTTRLVRKIHGPAGTKDYSFWLFDTAALDRGFDARAYYVKRIVERLEIPNLFCVPQVLVHNPSEASLMEAKFIARGYEGGVLRTLDGIYLDKPGENRATHRENIGWKLKQFVDGEALVLRVEPLMHNQNEAFLSEKGLQKRSKVAAGLKASKTLMGSLYVRDLSTGVEFSIGSGFTEADRLRRDWKGKILVYKKFPHGEKERPRHPIYKGIRDETDIL